MTYKIDALLNRIRKATEGLSVREVAETAGIPSLQTVTSMRADDNWNPTATTIRAFEKAFIKPTPRRRRKKQRR